MRLNLSSIQSPLGELMMVTDAEHKLLALDLIACKTCQPRMLRSDHDFTYGPPPVELATALGRYFDGDLEALQKIVIEPSGSAFQHEVWNALRRIPAGQTTSYGQLAKDLGYDDPRIAKVVGAANAANPIAIVIPCHRVIAKNGDLKGYAWGVERKKWLLNHEGALLEPSRPLELSFPGF